METIHRCPVCDAEAARSWPGLVAPFIAERVLRRPVELCDLFECESCTLRFFGGRYSPEEMERLYSGYRGSEYFRARHHHEPWYSEKFNRGMGGDPKHVAARQEALLAFLRDAGAPGPFRAVLDYGGDAGQFIPKSLSTAASVFDVSGVPAVEGVTAVARDQDLVPEAYDLILLSHVLEHLPDPMAQLARLRRLLRADEGLVYVEVPLERPWLGLVGRGSARRRYLETLRKHQVLLRVMDFSSTLFRVKVNIVPPFGFVKLHEHVNFFSEGSLRVALDRTGFDVLHVGKVSTVGPRNPPNALACLARARATMKAPAGLPKPLTSAAPTPAVPTRESGTPSLEPGAHTRAHTQP